MDKTMFMRSYGQTNVGAIYRLQRLVVHLSHDCITQNKEDLLQQEMEVA